MRLDRLEDDARAVVRAAACAGRRVSHPLLATVVGQPEDVLEGALRAAVEQNILVRVGADSYAFRHALLAEAVYDDLLPGERVRLHAAYAEALSSHRVDGTAAELARHARLAHDPATAVRASVEAGDEAMSVGGPDEAARHFETALELVADPRVAVELDHVDLAVRAADALLASGHPERAVKLVRAQLSHLPADAPAHHRARLLMSLATATHDARQRGRPAGADHRGARSGARRADRDPGAGCSACTRAPTCSTGSTRRPRSRRWRRSAWRRSSTCPPWSPT